MISAIIEPMQRTGFVYVIKREDIKTCYVGQSIVASRPYMHLKPGTYRYDELHVDGVIPEVSIAQIDIEYGDVLDEAERVWMRKMIDDGWNLVNHLGPDDVWPRVPTKYASLGGKKRGTTRAKNLHAKRAIDPEFNAWWRSVCVMGGNAVRARRETDPEFNARMREAELRGLTKGIETRNRKRAEDPERAEAERKRNSENGRKGGPAAGKKTSAIRRSCLECNMTTTPGGMWWHQKGSGHIGFTDINPNTVLEVN